jgi:hypothetical protein
MAMIAVIGRTLAIVSFPIPISLNTGKRHVGARLCLVSYLFSMSLLQNDDKISSIYLCIVL